VIDGTGSGRDGGVVTDVQTLPRTAHTPPVTWRSVVVTAALVLLPGLAYAATVLLPFAASDLDTLSLTELATGVHDPDGPGPGTGIPAALHLPGLVALLLAPLGALLALGGSVLQLLAAFPRQERPLSPTVAAGLGMVAVVSLGVLAWFRSPLGRALITWQLD
jgi:hypothetical protein